MEIALPQDVRELLGRLNAAGFEAFAVGGCVRDSLRGAPPHDWDICTAALPQQTMQVFACERVIGTGLKHGTVTVLLQGQPYEVTTYRVDGRYTDGRRPDSVAFTGRLEEDLARRDFTINAMAWHPDTGLRDPFGGEADLRARIIRCVGRPEVRFAEDALRILRAVRFAARLGFEIEPQTAEAMRAGCRAGLLKAVSPERIREEVCGLLTGKYAGKVLEEHGDVLAACIPQLRPMQGFEQHSPWHCRTVWGHTACAVGSAACELPVRLALLLHDCGKPGCFTLDENGVGHFYGHAARSAEIARKILRELKFDNETASAVEQLVLRHDLPLTSEKPLLRRRLAGLGEKQLRRLIEVQRGDVCGKAEALRDERLELLCEVERALDELLREENCFSLAALAVNGRDVMAAGVPRGPAVGCALKALLGEVLNGTLKNEKGALLARLEEMKKAGL